MPIFIDTAAMDASLKTSPPPAATKKRTAGISPLFAVACGALLTLGGALVYSLEPGPAGRQAPPETVVFSETAAARSLQRARDREADVRAEQERRAAEEAAERARRVTLEIDGAAVAEARKQRAELARRQAEAAEAQRAAADAEDAWKRFYRPSATCRDPAAAATVECVNEYVRAKREFQARGLANAN
jgi:hypothetical protein